MKRLWLALALLLAMLGTSIWNARCLDRFTADLSGTLLQAEAMAFAGQEEQAGALTAQARSRWMEHSPYLHVVLRHSDTDEVQTGFDEALRLLSCGELGEYAAANARLTGRLRLIAEAEQLNLENLF